MTRCCRPSGVQTLRCVTRILPSGWLGAGASEELHEKDVDGEDDRSTLDADDDDKQI